MKLVLPHERIILPLDVSLLGKAINLVFHLKDFVGMFKIGFEAIYSTVAGLLTSPNAADRKSYLDDILTLAGTIGRKSFLDVKLNDIPNTMGKAARAIASMQPTMFNIHASAGEEAIKAAVANKGNSKLFGVTVLTSIDTEECISIFRRRPDHQVVLFSNMLLNAGADGIICAPKEGKLLRTLPEFDRLVIACPNVRPLWAGGKDDQNKDRQMTPEEAVKAGIDMLVIGRPITDPPPEIGGPVEAAKKIAKEISSALS